jgi:lysozyme
VQYKNAGRTFTFIKATEGLTVIDDLFAGDWKAAKKAGVLRGAYHFFHPHDNPLTAANTFLKTMGSLDVDDLPPMLDWEVSDGISASKQAAAAKVWLDRVEEVTGRVPILYIGPSYWNSLGNPQGFERYPLFLAHYGVSCPSVPPPWSQWLFWQKGQGAVTGVQADSVDLDLFFGSLADLVAALALGQTLP